MCELNANTDEVFGMTTIIPCIQKEFLWECQILLTREDLHGFDLKAELDNLIENYISSQSVKGSKKRVNSTMS